MNSAGGENRAAAARIGGEIGGIPRKQNPDIPAETRKTPRHSRRKQEKPPVIPAKAGIHFYR